MKKVLFLSCYPDNDYREMISSGIILSQAAQKFDKQIVKGFILNALNVDVALVVDSKKQWSTKETIDNSTITYHYCFSDENFAKRFLRKIVFARETINNWKNGSGDHLIVIDSLRPGSLEFARYAKKKNVPVILIVTDFPDLLFDKSVSFFRRIKNCLLKKYFYKQFGFADSIVILTEYMKNRILKNACVAKSTNFLVMEGLCDNTKNEINNRIDNVFLYSGILSKQFGLSNLVNAFINVKMEEYELHLYGSGDYVDELKGICKKHKNIKFFGVVPNEVILQKQKKARFLVNPRPISDEYTLYSFPSKTIEYMKSGRPVITTKLPGIPHDYYAYLLFFDGDSEESIGQSLLRLSKIDDSRLNKIGNDARVFVETEKNNKVQVSKILKSIFGEEKTV